MEGAPDNVIRPEDVAAAGFPELAAALRGEHPSQIAGAGSAPFPSEAFDRAVEEEKQNRDFSYATDTTLVAGIPVKLMTLRQALVLQFIGSPFICGGIAAREDHAIFLWYLSPNYTPDVDKTPFHPPSRWKRFFRRIACRPAQTPSTWQLLMIQLSFLPYEVTDVAIRKYVRQIFMDSPSSEPDEPKTNTVGEADSFPDGEAAEPPSTVLYSSFVTGYVDLFGSEYSWTRNATLDSPLPLLFQEMREIEHRKGIPVINPLSDGIKTSWIDAMNERKAVS